MMLGASSVLFAPSGAWAADTSHGEPTGQPPALEQKTQHAPTAKVVAKKRAADGQDASNARIAREEEKYEQFEQRLDALEGEVQSQGQREAADHAADAGLADKINGLSGWWNNTKIGSTVFYDLTDINNVNGVGKSAVRSTANGFSFDIKRFYITIDHQFDDQWSAELITDANYQSTLGQTSLFIKKAFVQWKYAPWLTVRVGSADMPWIPYDETIYGYRFVENTFIDRIKFGNSSDWGVHIFGTYAAGLLGYQFSMVSGSGYKKPVRSKQPDFEGRVNLNWKGFQLGVGGYDGTEGASDNSTPIRHHYTRFDALAAYTANGIRVGVEFFDAQHHGQETTVFTVPPAASGTFGSTAYGWEPFASWQFCPEWAVFGRYDWVRPLSDTRNPAAGKSDDRKFHNDYFNVGVDFKPIPMLDFALVYKHDHGANGEFADQNGTIGGNSLVPGNFVSGNNGTYQEIGLFGKVAF